MAVFNINVGARGNFIHEPSLAFANILFHEVNDYVEDIYQRVPLEDLMINIVSRNDYPEEPSLKRVTTIPNPNDLSHGKFSLESIYFKGLNGDTENIADYNENFINTKDDLGNIIPLLFNQEYPLNVLKRGLFIHGHSYLPLQRAYTGKIVLKYDFRYSNQSPLGSTLNFTLEINFGSLRKDEIDETNVLNFSKIKVLKQNQLSTPYVVPIFNESDEGGNNIPTYMKKGMTASTTSANDGLEFTITSLGNFVAFNRGGYLGNTSGTPVNNFRPIAITNPVTLSKLSKVVYDGVLNSDYLGGGIMPVTVNDYYAVVNNAAFQQITY